MKKSLIALPLLAMPIGLFIDGMLIINTRQQTLLDWIVFITGCSLCVFHLIWTFVLTKRDNMGRELVMMSAIGKMILFPIFLMVCAYAVGLVSTAPLFERAVISPILKHWAPMIAAGLVIFVYSLMSLAQMFGTIKMYDSEIIMLWESIVYSFLSWMIIWDFFIAVIELVRHYIYRRKLAAEREKDDE